MARWGGSFDHKRLGERRNGQEGRTATANGGSIVSRVGFDHGGCRHGVIDHGGVVPLGLLGTAKVRVIVLGLPCAVGFVVTIVPLRLRES